MDKIDFPIRLDLYLVESALAPSRAHAKKLIEASLVTVDSRTVTKASYSVTPSMKVTVLENDLSRYVSRGAFKLEKALDEFKIDVSGLIAVDFGASTGGFTDLLLQRGASRVYAIENGEDQLHEKLISDDRVLSFTKTNARYIEKGFIPLCDIAVMDVSFISQTKLYQSVVNVLKPDGIFISLIKPQFEAGREYLSKKGIVKDERVYPRVIEEIEKSAKLYGFEKMGLTESSILGGDGNREFLIYFKLK